MKVKEIHFYSSSDLIPDIEDFDNFCYTYVETEEAIMNDYYSIIHTTSMANLSMSLFDYNIDKIWIHDNDGEPFCIKRVKHIDRFHYKFECGMTEKEIQYTHNLLRMWMAGMFSNR